MSVDSKSRKGLATLIVAEAMPKSKGEGPKSSPYGLGLQAAAGELIAAVKKGDEEVATEALCSFIDQHLAERFAKEE